MYASPVSLFRHPPPRRRVNREKFAPVEVFFAPADVFFAPANVYFAPVERDACTGLHGLFISLFHVYFADFKMAGPLVFNYSMCSPERDGDFSFCLRAFCLCSILPTEFFVDIMIHFSEFCVIWPTGVLPTEIG
jgi:hypothetical protein